MKSIALAEALLRRKELEAKVAQLKEINKRDLVEVKVKRQAVADNIDEVIASVPVVPIENITHAYDWHAKQLRLVDACIQRANWETKIEVQDTVMDDYTTPEEMMKSRMM